MLHVPVKIEPRVDNKDGRRADGLFIMQERTIAIDVSVTHPWAKSYTTMALVPLGAASERERIKNAEYAERYNRQDIHFLPVVMETAGGLGTSAVFC